MSGAEMANDKGVLVFGRLGRFGRFARPLKSPLLWVCLALLCWGAVMVSAVTTQHTSGYFANVPPDYDVLQQGVWIALSLLVAVAVFHAPMHWWERNALWLAAGMVLLLAATLLGPKITGARRWIALGSLRVQPSELAKLVVVLFAASRLALLPKAGSWRVAAPILALVAMVGALLLAQPDTGAFAVVMAVALCLMYLGGVKARVVLLVAALLAVCVAMLWGSEYQRWRMFTFLDPWSDAVGAGYQLSTALIAIGRGEMFGVGLGNGIGTLHLPEAHNSFLLAAIGEAFGLMGIACLALVFSWLAWRLIMGIGWRAIAQGRVFAGLLAQGMGVWLALQAFFHMGVNLGVLPTNGFALPFMSYGASSIMANMVAIALVLRVEAENQELMHVEKERP